MQAKKEIVDFIFSSPNAPILVEEAMRRMEIELRKRKNFYNKIDKPNQKIKENEVDDYVKIFREMRINLFG